jgi:hypothetical protein
MTIRRRVAISVGVGLIFSLIGYLFLSVVDGVRNIFPSPFQYLVLTYALPHLGIREDEMGTTAGLFWILVIPWFAWTFALFLFMTVWTYVTRKDIRAA